MLKCRVKAITHLVHESHILRPQRPTKHCQKPSYLCFVSRCDVPADSIFDLPHYWRHPGFLHGPGTYTWAGCGRVHRCRFCQTSGSFHVLFCAHMCFGFGLRAALRARIFLASQAIQNALHTICALITHPHTQHSTTLIWVNHSEANQRLC